jgi:hypothetical protein
MSLCAPRVNIKQPSVDGGRVIVDNEVRSRWTGCQERLTPNRYNRPAGIIRPGIFNYEERTLFSDAWIIDALHCKTWLREYGKLGATTESYWNTSSAG